jgi:hypothetical protein
MFGSWHCRYAAASEKAQVVEIMEKQIESLLSGPYFGTRKVELHISYPFPIQLGNHPTNCCDL